MTMATRAIARLALAAMFAGVSSSAQTVTSHLDGSKRLNQYQTFSWTGAVEDSNGQALRDALTRDLTARGWRNVASGGDITISTQIAVETKQHTYHQTYDPDYDCRSPYHFAVYDGPGYVVTRRVALAASIVDSRSGSVVWNGTAHWQDSSAPGDPHGDMEYRKVGKAADKMLAKFPSRMTP